MKEELKAKLVGTVHPCDALTDYKYVGVFARYKGRWLFCRRKGVDTWEPPGGHIDPGETALEAAKRELWEETGALDFDIRPLCDYEAAGTTGACFLAEVHTLGPLPQEFEMEEIRGFDALPEKLTYPGITPKLFAYMGKCE